MGGLSKLVDEETQINSDIEPKLNFLYSAIQDTQETIKFTDTKSGTVIVLGTGIIAAMVTLIDKYIAFFNTQPNISKWVLIIGLSLFSIFLFVSLYLSLKSINPRNNPNEHIEFGDSKLKVEVDYYLTGLSPKMRIRDYIKEWKDSKFSKSVAQFYNSINNANSESILISLSYEFIKLSYIKEKKYKRTQCAIKWLEVCFITIGFTVLLFVVSYNVTSIDLGVIINKGINNKTIYWLVVIYFIIRFFLSILFQNIKIKNGWQASILSCIIYTVAIGLTGYLMDGLSILDIVIIFISSLFITNLDFLAYLKKLHLLQVECNTRLSFILNDFLHIGVLMVLSVLKI